MKASTSGSSAYAKRTLRRIGAAKRPTSRSANSVAAPPPTVAAAPRIEIAFVDGRLATISSMPCSEVQSGCQPRGAARRLKYHTARLPTRCQARARRDSRFLAQNITDGPRAEKQDRDGRRREPRPWLCRRARAGGAILVGTSSTVKEPFANLALSNVMRAGVTALVKTLAGELAAEGIRVNTLLPGRIATDRLTYLDGANAKKAGITVEEQRQRALATIPMGRYGEPDEFGRAGAFLLSDAAGYITGAALQVDGGLIRGLL